MGMTTSLDELTRHKIRHALVEYDRQQSKKRFYNPNALAIYMDALHCIEAQVSKGASLRRAILNTLTDRLADAVLVAVGEPKRTKEEWS
jgi:hypothetical protein